MIVQTSVGYDIGDHQLGRTVLQLRVRQRGPQRQVGGGFADQHDQWLRGHCRHDRRQHLDGLVVADVDLGGRLNQLVAEEIATQVGVQGHLDDSGLGKGVDKYDVLDAVGEVDRDSVALFDSRVLQRSGDAIGTLVQLSKRDPVARALHERPPRVERGFLTQPFAKGPAGPLVIVRHRLLHSVYAGELAG